MHRNPIMNKGTAILFKVHGVSAIRELTSALITLQNSCTEEEITTIKRSVGDIIARIDNILRESIYAEFPDLDDLQNF
jgi:ABC-type uncharacterized transport system ATPase subunit